MDFTELDKEIKANWFSIGKRDCRSVCNKKRNYNYDREYYKPKPFRDGYGWMKKSKWSIKC